MKKRHIIRAVLILLVCVAGWFVIQSGGVPKTDYNKVSSTGKAAIGGPFELIDVQGKLLTEKAFEGSLLLVYFGFTYCPDVCPVDVQIMSQVMKKMEEESQPLKALFVSVDPERDTPEQLRSYLSHFHPGIIGATGSVEQVKKTASTYKVYYSKTQPEDGSDYLVNHSAFFYLMDKDGSFLTHFPHNTSVDKIVQKIQTYH